MRKKAIGDYCNDEKKSNEKALTCLYYNLNEKCQFYYYYYYY